MRLGPQNGSFLSGGVRAARSLGPHLLAVLFGAEEDSRKSAIYANFWMMNTSVNQKYCTLYQRHVNHWGSGKNNCRRWRSPKCLWELNKRSRYRLHGSYWEEVENNPFLVLNGQVLCGQVFITDVSKRCNKSITSPFPPTGILHYSAKKEILHRTWPFRLAEYHPSLQMSSPGHSTNPLTSQSHLEALTSSRRPHCQCSEQGLCPSRRLQMQTICMSTMWEGNGGEMGRLALGEESQCSPAASSTLRWHRQLNWTNSDRHLLVTVPSAGLTRHTHLLPFGVLKSRKQFWLISGNKCESFSH